MTHFRKTSKYDNTRAICTALWTTSATTQCALPRNLRRATQRQTYEAGCVDIQPLRPSNFRISKRTSSCGSSGQHVLEKNLPATVERQSHPLSISLAPRSFRSHGVGQPHNGCAARSPMDAASYISQSKSRGVSSSAVGPMSYCRSSTQRIPLGI